MRKAKTVKVWEVLADTNNPNDLGPAQDGTKIFRFWKESDARNFASKNTLYGKKQTEVFGVDVPKHIADRWTII